VHILGWPWLFSLFNKIEWSCPDSQWVRYLKVYVKFEVGIALTLLEQLAIGYLATAQTHSYRTKTVYPTFIPAVIHYMHWVKVRSYVEIDVSWTADAMTDADRTGNYEERFFVSVLYNVLRRTCAKPETCIEHCSPTKSKTACNLAVLRKRKASIKKCHKNAKID